MEELAALSLRLAGRLGVFSCFTWIGFSATVRPPFSAGVGTIPFSGAFWPQLASTPNSFHSGTEGVGIISFSGAVCDVCVQLANAGKSNWFDSESC